MYLKFVNIMASKEYDIPPEYKRVFCLGSNNAIAYIDTGLTALQIKKIVARKRFFQTSSSVVGDGLVANGVFYLITGGIVSSKFGAHYGGQAQEQSTGMFDNDWHTFTLDCVNLTYSVDSTSISLPTPSSQPQGVRTFWLFVRNDGGTSRRQNSEIAEYWFYGNDNFLIMHLIPAVRKSDNTIGMYDVISQRFISQQGTGSLYYVDL